MTKYEHLTHFNYIILYFLELDVQNKILFLIDLKREVMSVSFLNILQ